MKAADVFPSKYLKADDCNGGELTFTIQELVIEDISTLEGDDESKPVLHFMETKKGLVLNRTNWAAIATLYGEESDDWKMKPITLHAPSGLYFGKIQPALRVKA